MFVAPYFDPSGAAVASCSRPAERPANHVSTIANPIAAAKSGRQSC
jgi:hypothetical protein